MDITLIREVFRDFKKTCEVLGIDEEIIADINHKLTRLSPILIGSRGQILEWHQEFAETEPGHRHFSHLYGLFPSELFEDDVIMREACRVSLENRLKNGGGHTGWSCAWIINFFAILGKVSVLTNTSIIW
jgi:alpha-L-fucosidase 2